MIFKDRQDAGQRLALLLEKQKTTGQRQKAVVLSLLKGGAIIGKIVAETLKAKHTPLPVAKIRSPYNDEFAIGALCFDEVLLDQKIVSYIDIHKNAVQAQISDAKSRFLQSIKSLDVSIKAYRPINNKKTIVVDDGVATGVSARAATMFLRRFLPQTIVFAAPVGPAGTSIPGADKTLVLHAPTNFNSVSSFYKTFPHVTDQEVWDIFNQ
ncbi:MAG: phosphoribosyltransferase family protein [Patescibacteria group bacterium]